MKKIIEQIDKISNEEILITYDDNTQDKVKVIKIQSRKEALELCTRYTKEALKRDDAFERLNSFFAENLYNRLRNYEIEMYLDKVSEKIGHKINELCPKNGFMFFD